MPSDDDLSAQDRQPQARTDAQQDKRRQLAAQTALLDGLGVEFAVSKNPICVTEAWRLCRRTGLPAPEWILNHFDRFAEPVHELAVGPPAGRLANEVATAIGFGFNKKNDNPLTDWRDRLRGERWFQAFEEHLQRGLSPTATRRKIAEQYAANEPVVRRCLNRFALRFGMRPEQMVEQRKRIGAEIRQDLDNAEGCTQARLDAAWGGQPDPNPMSDL
jgi:hypothetical protein